MDATTEPAATPETSDKHADVASGEPTCPTPDESELTTLDLEFASGDAPDVPEFGESGWGSAPAI